MGTQPPPHSYTRRLGLLSLSNGRARPLQWSLCGGQGLKYLPSGPLQDKGCQPLSHGMLAPLGKVEFTATTAVLRSGPSGRAQDSSWPSILWVHHWLVPDEAHELTALAGSRADAASESPVCARARGEESHTPRGRHYITKCKHILKVTF